MAKHFNGAYSVRAGYHGSRKKNIANASSVGDNFVFCVECNRYYPKSANHAHDVMQYASNSGESDLETARANAMYYKRQAESQAARIAELEQALRGDKTTFPIATHNGLHIYSDADAVERKIISLEAELSAALEDARSLANFIDYHCVEDMPDALTREIVNKYTGTSDAALGK